jgi:tetratricopeptide (TPR) repeat protein
LLTLNRDELPDTESLDVYADYSSILRALRWLNFGVLIPLAAIGAWMHRGRWRDLAVLHATFVALVGTIALFYVVARYRHPLAPVLLLFSAAGLAGLAELRGHLSQVRRWAPPVIVAAVAAVIAHLPFDVARDETYLNLGTLLAQNGRPADAIPMLLRAVKVDPRYAEPHFRLGLAYRDAGDAAAALEQFREAAWLAPESADAHTNFGSSLLEAGRLPEAIAERRRAVTLSPDRPGPRGTLAAALAASRNFEDAFAQFAEAVRLQPDNAGVRIDFGNALCETGKVSEGIEQYEAAALAAPRSVDAPYLAAQAYARIGRLDDARAKLEQALAIARSTGRTDLVPRIEDAIRRVQRPN